MSGILLIARTRIGIEHGLRIRSIFPFSVLTVANSLGGSHYMWTFVLPDVIHTLIMGDYLYIWLRKVKSERIDPYLMGNLTSNV